MDGEILSPANLNSETQIVIAGSRDAVERAVGLCSDAGARKTVMLPVSAPFHCDLMQPARRRLSVDLDEVTFRDAEIPVCSNVDAQLVRTGGDAREALKRQVTSPVKWAESMRAFDEAGVGHVLEVGPSKVLIGLVRKSHRHWGLNHVDDEASLRKAIAAFEGA